MKVLLWPAPDQIEPNHGIGRIIHAQYKYLPKLGVEFVFDPYKADIVAAHTQQDELPWIDVLHLHGMYWTAEPKSGVYYAAHHRANYKIMEAARRAHIVTVPSPWCAMPFRRDMRLTPWSVGHGIDFAEWSVGEPKGYVLWNKNRNGDVCDPTPILELAYRGIRGVTTFTPSGTEPPANLTVTGALPHEKMKLLVQHADVYLATVKETFGIGTLEALACGVPVLGYNHGGTADIVEHKVTGYLAQPGNIDDLVAGYEYCMAHRAELSENARDWARMSDWEFVIPQYLRVYEAALERKQAENTKVSIVITNYNYAKYLPEAIESAVAQTVDCEVVVVDDGSTDGSSKLLDTLAGRYPIRVIQQTNQGVASARNRGISEATGGFVVCLDADDRLDAQYAQILRNALANDRGLGVAYTGLGLIEENGNVRENVGWPPPFTWANQSKLGNPPNNCVPCAAMFRKSMWERAGGYRQEYAPGEDTEFFTRGLSVGYTALKVVDEPLFHYRPHSGSASRTKQYTPIDAFLPWMRDQQYPMAAPLDQGVPPVRSYSVPLVSVIIPVSKKHVKFLSRALDSVIGQTMREWEVIVVADGMLAKEVMQAPYPFATYIQYTGGKGTAGARNLGLTHAKSPLTVFLDADDLLMPDALAEMCRAYAESNGRYIYTDWVAMHNGKADVEVTPAYEPMAFMHAGQHAVTVMIATEDARRIGFDESFTYLEDWNFFADCAIAGVQGRHLAKPLVAVTIHSDRKTAELAKSQPLFEEAAHKVFDRLVDYREGKKEMGGCCGGNGDSLLAAKEAAFGRNYPVTDTELPLGQVAPDVVRMEFIGDEMGGSFFGGQGATKSGRRYKGGRNSHDRYIDAAPEDVAWLENSGKFRKVVQPQEQAPRPSAESVLETLSRLSGKTDLVSKAPQEELKILRQFEDVEPDLDDGLFVTGKASKPVSTPPAPVEVKPVEKPKKKIRSGKDIGNVVEPLAPPTPFKRDPNDVSD